ncbi:DnaJ family domain-containing protein [Natranaerobius thermophilus]|uniref:DnaJ homologue subfamily C member 28 conserved domain-containing protein n=1 Tax=Natranaerobius thermophilus (strain ATCC BAA-1301 / DSM 18059 / JW/NM-WN-LF) TaxID=457570 RepID=B2A6T5_NATTJ|nr:DnaJ family domain-containing protein [Natranaerobius thermophilus]ACB84216.1 conserved hypothetical protein [Natranaerobius thermophilus JW/NM-WN-LF]
MKLFEQMCEEKIRQAEQDGVFDNLPGKGKPLELQDLSQVPEELRAGYKILKNSGYLPEEVQLKKELVNLDDLIKACNDPDEKQDLKRQRNEKMLRFNQLMEKRSIKKTSAFKKYRNKIRQKFT